MCSAAQLHGVHGSRDDPGGATTVVDEAPLSEANDAKEDADNADDETGSAEQGLEEVPAVVLNPEQPEGLVDLLPDFLAGLSRTPPDFLVDLVLQLTTRPPHDRSVLEFAATPAGGQQGLVLYYVDIRD